MFDDKLICAPSEGTYWLATFVSSELQSVTSMIMSRLAKQPLGTELLSNASLKNGDSTCHQSPFGSRTAGFDVMPRHGAC
jgi:hypothetical protein